MSTHPFRRPEPKYAKALIDLVHQEFNYVDSTYSVGFSKSNSAYVLAMET